MGYGNWVHLDVEEIVQETEAAFLRRLDGGEQVWLPKSQVDDAEAYTVGDEDLTVSVTEWIAKQKGLE